MMKQHFYSNIPTLLSLLCLLTKICSTQAFQTRLPISDINICYPSSLSSLKTVSTTLLATKQTSLFAKQPSQEQEESEDSLNPVTKASWYAVEAFGKIFGSKDEKGNANEIANADDIDLTQPPSSLQEAFRRIQMDNDRSYFLSGEVDVLAYDIDCIFSDPFVAFSGRERFVDNLANLGSFITEYDARMINYEEDASTPLVQTKVMVKLELNLPWKPILAWPWGVTYQIDPTSFLITEHKESWDIAPIEGVKQIFRKPTSKIKARAN